MSVKRFSAHRRDGRCNSCGNTEQPTGTSTVASADPAIHSFTCRMLSQYSRAAEAPVRGSQYSIRLSSRSSRLTTASRGPSWSVQDQNFSAIQAARKAGESTSPYPTVCGRVACSRE
jgi:hypothetical protein